MPYLKDSEIERIAQRVTAAYRKLPSVRENPESRLRPELLISELLGLKIKYCRLSLGGYILGVSGGKGLGVKIYDKPECPEYYYLDGKTVLIEKSLIAEGTNVGRLHFCQVHEACHQILRMLYPREHMMEGKSQKLQYSAILPYKCDDYWEEWRTNRLASAVLMPVDMLMENMEVIGLGGGVRMLNKIFAPDEYERFSKVAEYMGVSKQALAIRLKRLGMLDQDYLRDPYALVDIFPDEGEMQ